ncbi:MAG: Gfo/Idh/MocA family oxidoreductase [Planctomycetota bacterium]
MGMVGGGVGAFIGTVHRTAACLDGAVEFVAGALSSTPERARASGEDLGLADDRNYPTWQAMVEGEAKRSADERIDFVSIVTPNDSHYAIARAFIDAKIPVICDKPLVHTSEQARDLYAAAQKNNVVFAVTYNYSGYPMVKEARRLVADGLLGDVRKVVVEYNQGWLATKLEESGQKQAEWRTDPTRSGIGGAIGDIGSHAEQLVSYVTGLELASLCADLTTFVPGRPLDDDANVLLRFDGGAKGLLFVSQVCVGNENDLRLRVWGTRGAIEWHQEDPNELKYQPAEEPERILRRGNPYLGEAATAATRIPPGHPEAFLEAFANVYNGATAAIRAGAGADGGEEFDYPDLRHGARGVHFIEKTVESSRAGASWVDARFDL